MRRLTRHERPAAAQARALRTGRPGAQPLTALLIAGDPQEVDRYAAKLRADGYAVVPAAGLDRGLELAAGRRPDLIFVCLGAWAVPALVLLVLRSEPGTRAVPTVLVSDRSRADLAAAVGGLLATENVVPRHAAYEEARL